MKEYIAEDIYDPCGSVIGVSDHGELIRCKDCQYWMKNPYRESSVFGLCFKHKDIAIATDETDWCSWAERKNDEIN